MTKIVFIGAEAEGYYSDSYKCRGAFLTEEINSKYEDKLSVGTIFHELDGKHSETEGDSVYETFSNVIDAVKFVNEKDVDYETYYVTENSYDELGEDEVEEVEKDSEGVHKLIQETMRDLVEVTFYLSEEDAKKVSEFVEDL